MKRLGIIAAAAFLCLALVPVASGAKGESDEDFLNHLHELKWGEPDADTAFPAAPGGHGVSKTGGPFSKQQITRFRCSSSGNPAVSVDMSCNTATYGQTWAPDNEIAISVDPTNADHLLAGSNDYYYRFNNSTGARQFVVPTGFFTSFDGGRTWVDGQIPMVSGDGAGDPAPAFDRKHGVALMAQLENVSSRVGATLTNGDVTVSRSTDGGLHWQRPVRVVNGGGNANNARHGVFIDKEWLTVDNHPSSPFYGRAYVTATKFINGPHGSYAASPIVLSYSDDGGRTWSAPKIISGSAPTCTFQTTGGGTVCDEDQNSIPEVASDGTLYVYFLNGQNEGAWEVPFDFDSQIMVVRSQDGGGSFTDARPAAQLEDGLSDMPYSVIGRQTVWGHQLRWGSAGDISVDPTDPQHVTVVWSDRHTPNPNATDGCFFDAPGDAPNYDPCHAGPSSNVDIWRADSTDGGQTWGPRQRVSTGTGHIQEWFPWSDYTPSGQLDVAWDRDNQPSVGAIPANDTFNHVLRQGSGGVQVLAPNTAEGRSPTEHIDVSVTHWAGQYVPESAWPRVCGPAGYSDPPVANAAGKDCNAFHGDYTGLAVGPDGSVNVTWTGLNRFVQSPQIDRYTGQQHDGFAQDAMFARR